jgi:transcriptional regulator with XRE-family HTH domain
MKRDRRDGAQRPCLTPTIQNPGAVKLARVTAGLEQQQLADKIGVSKGYMSEIEKGTRSVPPPKLKAIADALGIETATLINPAFAEAAQQPYQDGETTEDDPGSEAARAA